MNLKDRLQRMLQIVEESELVGVLADIERDILLGELREAYTELKFGKTENKNEAVNEIVAPAVEEEGVAEPAVEEEGVAEPAVEEEGGAEPAVVEETPIAPIEVTPVEVTPVEVTPVEVAEETAVEEPAVEEPTVEEKEDISTLYSPLSTPKRSPLLSLYEDEPTPVLGEQFHEAPSVADTIACPKGVAESTPVVSLREAIGVADKFMLIRELFGGDEDAYDRALDAIESQPSFDDCIIYISENYVWSPNSQATKFVMELLQRKYNA